MFVTVLMFFFQTKKWTIDSMDNMAQGSRFQQREVGFTENNPFFYQAQSRNNLRNETASTKTAWTVNHEVRFF